MKKFFVTATGTDIGKTFISAALASHARNQGLSVRVAKPVISGFDEGRPDGSDTAVLLASAGFPVTSETVPGCSPWRFKAPLSPDMAAAREDRSIDFPQLVNWCRDFLAASDADLTLIEGVGGVMVPLDTNHTIRDLIAALDIPILLVAGSYLGTLSHTLTALAALAPLECRIIINKSSENPVPAEETATTLARFTTAPISIMPRLAEAQRPPPVILDQILNFRK